MRRKLKISGRDLRYALAFALIVTVATSVVAYTILNPPASEHFFAMWVLGSKGLAEDYYPNNNPTLTTGESVNWTLGINNQMGRLEYVVLRVKLLNATLASPNGTNGTPSPVPEVFEFRRILVDNETWSIPFAWRILNMTQEAQRIFITGISINQDSFHGNLVSAISGGNFRFVFELWFYEESSSQLSFTWTAEGAHHSVWTQIWFNATMTP